MTTPVTQSSLQQSVPNLGIRTAENKKNYQKAQELLSRGILVLLIFFHMYFPCDPQKLNFALQKHEPTIKKLFNKGILKQNQLDLIFPPGCHETFSDKFDPPIMRVLLANFGNTAKPKKFWTSNKFPSNTDQSNEANALRIMIARNIVSHSTGYMTTADYTRIAKILIDAMVALGEDKSSFINILPPTKHNLLKPVKSFSGRDKDIHSIHTIVQNGKTDITRLVVHGMAGIGKSEVVRKYCDDYGRHFDNNVLWMNSTNQTTLETSYKDIAETVLNLDIKEQNNGNYKGISFIVNAVHQHLRNDSVLFVFDDASDVTTVIPFLPNYQPSCTIITSQIASWPQGFENYQLEQFDNVASKTFLTENLNRNNIKLNTRQISEVTLLLDGHPLAMQQFVSAIKNTMFSVQEYIDLLKSQTAKLLSLNFPTIQGHRSTVSSILINIQNLIKAENSKLAHEILNTISYLYNEDISFDVLKILFSETNILDLDNAIQILLSFSLINIRNRKITVHSLIQKTLKYKHHIMEDSEKYRRKCTRTFQNQLNVKEDVYRHSDFAETWYKDFIYFISLNLNESDTVYELVLAHPQQIFYILKEKGRIEDFIEILTSIQEIISTAKNSNHREAIHTQFWIARCYYDIGKIERSIGLYRKVITELGNSFDGTYPDVCTTMNNLAMCYFKSGQINNTIKLHRETLEKRKSMLEANHPDILQSMNNLAACYEGNGQIINVIELEYLKSEKCEKKRKKSCTVM